MITNSPKMPPKLAFSNLGGIIQYITFMLFYQTNNPAIAADSNDTKIPEIKINGTCLAT